MDPKHLCGKCQGIFTSEDSYINHLCGETGYTPADPRSMGPNHEAISEAALKRGEARKDETIHPADMMAAREREDGDSLPVE